MKKFQGKYRIGSARASWWDYGWNAAYFVTICTENHEHYFGFIKYDKMNLSEIGNVANDLWLEIPEHFPFVKLGVFIVMPNHVHGIVIIDKQYDVDSVETQNFAFLQSKSQTSSKSKNKFGPQSKNLGSVMRGYKTGVKKYATMSKIEFTWQSRYHDRIIRDEYEFQRIERYIKNNPHNWDNDKLR